MNDENKKSPDVLIGSLWSRQVGEGKTLITGVINGKRVKVVLNNKPKGDTSPTHFVFEIMGSDKDVQF